MSRWNGKWRIDFENSTLTPDSDGEEPLCYWWEDIRPQEVLVAIQEAYERGYAKAKEETFQAETAITNGHCAYLMCRHGNELTDRSGNLAEKRRCDCFIEDYEESEILKP